MKNKLFYIETIFLFLFLIFSLISISFMTIFVSVFFIIILIDIILILLHKIDRFKRLQFDKIKIKNNLPGDFNLIKDFIIKEPIIYFFMFFGFFLISVIFSTNIKLTLKRLPIYITTFAIYFTFLIYLLLNYQLIKKLLNLHKNKLIIAFSLIVFIFFLSQILFILNKFKFKFHLILINRSGGLLGSPIALSSVLVFWFFYMIFLFLRSKTLIIKIINLINFILLILLLLITQSRMAILSIVLIFILFLFIFPFKVSDRKKRKIIIIFYLILIIIFILAFHTGNNKIKKFNLYKRFTQLTNSINFSFKYLKGNYKISSQSGINYRLGAWKASVKVIEKRFFTGTGPFAWKYYITEETNILMKYLILKGWWQHTHCHNDFLQIYAEMGVPAGISFTIFIILLFIYSIKIILKENYKNIFFYSAFVFLTMFLTGLTDYIVFHPNAGVLVATNYALLSFYSVYYKEVSKD